MSQSIQVSDESAALLAEQAASHGLSIGAWVEVLARGGFGPRLVDGRAGAAVDRILEIQASVKPDPEGWTTLDYVRSGRR